MRKAATNVRMETHRQELQYAGMLSDRAFKLWAPLIGRERHRGNRAAIVVNGDCKSAPDTEPSGFFE